ncbi:hypothetical protein [Salinivibrio proteolyticus]|uniref:SMODS and SLOG-associating 2TM effector domain-containing protein n=1 Tax=Salinivibrio proteolyticus TaxID=334715 RepID=A0ABY7LGQ2_9GAMM|nr:hypothetical protein [Salinivibrio proteolyticus]WBA16385.1 hypothetical protein N7E60_16760 [Salinivibrio proteolyticus]
MPKISGDDIISDLTEKSGRRLLVVSFMTILVKLYDIDLGELNLFGINVPADLFDLLAVILMVYFFYTLLVNWLGDLAGFKLWFSNNNIHSNFGTNMELDKNFLNGGRELLRRLHELEFNGQFPNAYDEVDEETKKKYIDFKTNVELYCVRLEGAGQRFSALSKYGHFYIWFQSFLLPIIVSVVALYLVCSEGSFQLPVGISI